MLMQRDQFCLFSPFPLSVVLYTNAACVAHFLPHLDSRNRSGVAWSSLPFSPLMRTLRVRFGSQNPAREREGLPQNPARERAMADLFSDAAAPGSSSSPEILFETRRVAELHAEIDAKEEGNRQKISSSYTTWPILAYDPPIVNTLWFPYAADPFHRA